MAGSLIAATCLPPKGTLNLWAQSFRIPLYDIANWYAIAYCDCCFAHIPTSTWTSGLQIMVPYWYLVARISPTSATNVSKSENSTGWSFWYSFCGTFT